MPDWNDLVRRRLAALNLTAPQNPTSPWNLRSTRRLLSRPHGRRTPLDDAYRQVLAEFDRGRPLNALVHPKHRTPRHEAVPAGDPASAAWVTASGATSATPRAVCARILLFVAFVVLTLAFGIGANTTVFTVPQYADP